MIESLFRSLRLVIVLREKVSDTVTRMTMKSVCSVVIDFHSMDVSFAGDLVFLLSQKVMD